MALLPQPIPLTGIEPSKPGGDGRRFPPAWYAMKITSSEVKNSGKGNPRLIFCYEVVEGPLKGATIFHGLNIVHPTEKTQEIALRELKAITEAAGYASGALTDSSVIHGVVIDVKIRCQRDNAKYDEVCGTLKVGTKSRDEANVAAQSVPVAQAPAAAQGQVAQAPVGQVAQPPGAQAQVSQSPPAGQPGPAQGQADMAQTTPQTQGQTGGDGATPTGHANPPAWGTPTDQA